MDSRIAKQRTALVLDHPFIGALALRLKVREDLSCKTFWTDGETLGYNPTYAERLNDLEVRGVLAHEVWHVAGGHCWRQGDRDPNGWNEACDYVVNLMVEAAGMQLPSGVLIDHRFKGCRPKRCTASSRMRNAKWRSSLGENRQAIRRREVKPGSLTGSPGSQPPQPSDDKAVGPAASCGEVRQMLGLTRRRKRPSGRWPCCRRRRPLRRGKLGGALQAAVEQSVAAVGDWRSLLHRFAQDAAPTDYTWAQPNRRYLHVGMYLPSLNEPAVGDAVFVRDASGSVWDETQAQFAAEILAVADAVRPRRLIVLDCDVRVTQVQVFERGEPAELAPLKGGGGTSFIDPFRWVKKEEIDPAFLVYLTDMAGTFPSEAPAYAVLWASTTPLKRARRAPFGETIEVVC
jgi:predicted metal-dependent peptidase